MAWSFDSAAESVIDELMPWFPDAAATRVWGGPHFRYPFDRASFQEDCRLQDYTPYSLRDPAHRLAAFGQIGVRFGRAHFARLAVNPEQRGRGVGRRLLKNLLEVSANTEAVAEAALFVYRDNAPALACYHAVGFSIQDYPPNASLADECYYMTRPL